MGRLMDLQSDSVAGSVKEPLHPAPLQAGRKALRIEEVPNRLMDLPAAGAWPGLPERQGLTLGHTAVERPDLVAGPAPDHGSGDVSPIAVLLRAREDIQDDGPVGRQGSVTLVVGVAALGSAGHDGMGGHEPQFQQHGVDRLFHPGGGEGAAVLFQPSPGIDPGLPDEIDAGLESGFGGALRPGDLPDLSGFLDLALVEEGTLLDPDAQSAAAQLKGQARREVEGNQQGAHSPGGQQPVQHRRRRDRAPTFPAEFGLQGGQGKYFVHPGLAAGAIDLQVVHHQVRAAAVQETGKGIGSEESGGVEQVGILLAGRKQQPGLGVEIVLVMFAIGHERRMGSGVPGAAPIRPSITVNTLS